MVDYLLNNIFFVFSAMLELSFGIILIHTIRHQDSHIAYPKAFISFWGLFYSWTPNFVDLNLPLNYQYHLALMPRWQLVIITLIIFGLVFSTTNFVVIMLAKLLTRHR